MKKQYLTLAAAVLTAIGASQAVAETRAGAFTWTPGVEWFWFNDDLNLDPEIAAGAELGYNFTENLNAAIAAQFSSAETDDDTGGADVRHYELNGRYQFGAMGGWEPYVQFGAGRAKVDYSGATDDVSETTLNLGGGLKYIMTDDAALRIGLRDVYGMDSEASNVGLAIAMEAQFGGEKAAAPEAPKAAPPPSAEEPKDSDKDGVTDDKDQCPDTPMEAKVDEKGCNVILKETVSIELNIEFETAKDEVREAYQLEVEKLAKFLKEYPDTKVVVEGHTDSRGSDAYNQKLSDRRANSVKNELVQRYGIDAARVSAIGFGESKPVADNNTDEGRQQNRRVIGVVSATVEKIEKR
jgi:OmpA-OmpF porin, OOP family